MRTRNLAMILGVAFCLPGFALAQSGRVEPGDPPIMKPMLVATEAEVIQFDQRGEIVWRTPSGVARDVWQLAGEDVKEMGPRWFAGFRLLPNGNIMVCNAGGTVPFFEVNRQKQVVWHTGLTTKQVGIAHGLYVLDEQHGGGPSGLGAALAAARNGACSRVSRPGRSAFAYSTQTAIFGSARSVSTAKEKEVSLYGSFSSP